MTCLRDLQMFYSSFRPPSHRAQLAGEGQSTGSKVTLVQVGD